MTPPSLVIISPALATANNGNWQTASRWADFIRTRHAVRILDQWNGADYAGMMALHARRSADSIARYATAFPSRPLVVVLTGTDIYRDIHTDAHARRSLQLATRLVVLQDAGLEELPAALREKTHVIYQSCTAIKAAKEPDRTHVECVMIGHLREEKDPLTFMQAARLVQSSHVMLTQIGDTLREDLHAAAISTAASQPRYRWLGALPHAAAREHLAQASLLVLPSRMEGGANVIAEAIRSGIPVVASDIPGNRGMLGQDYAGLFPVGDAAKLASLIDRCAQDTNYLAILQRQCQAREHLFRPERERAALLQLLDNLRF